jgi:hypothetical protein
MTLTEILPTVQKLPDKDKIELIRTLVEELSMAEDIYPFEPGKIWHGSKLYLCTFTIE